MKQYRITSQDILQDSEDDCYLAPNDPIQELKIASYLGGLGSEEKLAEYRASVSTKNKLNTGNFDKGAYMKANNIKPGTEAWFKLWYGKNES